ncbi:MAG: hypothetical protein JXR19_08360 [Bacteroidia bacterium]
MNIKSTLIVISTLLLGMLIGFLGAGRLAKHRIHRMHEMSMNERHEGKMLFRKLDLSADQKEQIEEILKKHKPAHISLMNMHRNQRDSLRDEMFTEMHPILNEDQRAKLAKMKDKHKGEMKGHRRHKGNKRHNK